MGSDSDIVLGPTVNFLLTPSTQQNIRSMWAGCDLVFSLSLCVCIWLKVLQSRAESRRETLYSWSEDRCLCNSAYGTVRANSSSSVHPAVIVSEGYRCTLWLLPSTLTAKSSPSSKSHLMDGTVGWKGAKWCLGLLKSLLMSGSRWCIDTGWCRHFSFSSCLLIPRS